MRAVIIMILTSKRRRIAHSHGLLVFITVVAGSVICTAAFANRYVTSDDHFLDRREYRQFNPIGRVDSLRQEVNWKGQAGYGRGTAFLVSPCYALTNHHVVFGEDFPPYGLAEERAAVGAKYAMKFSVGVGANLPFAGRVTASPVVWGERDGANANDWALLKLSSCLGARPEIGWMEIDLNRSFASLIRARQPVALASYPFDRGDDEGSFVGESLRLAYGFVRGYLKVNGTHLLSASGDPGSSGGAVMVMEPGGGSKIIGIYRGGRRRRVDLEKYIFNRYSDEYANEFIGMWDIMASYDVKERVAADRLHFGLPNPNGLRLLQDVPQLEHQR